MKKYLIAGVLGLGIAATAFSFYLDTTSATAAYEKPEEKGFHKLEQKVEREAQEMKEANAARKQNKAEAELAAWNKLSKQERIKLVEEKHKERVAKSAASWAKKSADKKIEQYEKSLKRRAMNKEEKAKAAKERLNEKCKDLEDN